jgi:hypothetical protein
MNSNLRNRLLIAAVLATSAPLVLASTAAAAQGYGQQKQESKDAKDAKAKKAKAKDERQAATEARQEARQRQDTREQRQGRDMQRERQAAAARAEHRSEVTQAERQRQARMDERATTRRAQAEASAKAAAKSSRDADRHERQMAQRANQRARQEDRADRQQAQVANQAARQQQRSDRQVARRLAKADLDRLITQQKARVSSYRAWTTAQRAESQRIAAAVRAQNRAAQYAYINDYNNRLYAQQQRFLTQSFDYYNDPYYYTAPTYRYLRNGSYYTITQYGVNMLNTAVNDGYGEGYRAGKADRMDGWRADYRSNWVYQNASYGYSGYYLDRGEYSYYFREGFRRGYEDGYYSRYQYGSYNNGNYSIIGAVLNTILGLQPYSYRY